MSSINSDKTEEVFWFYDNFVTTLLITLSRFLPRDHVQTQKKTYLQNVYRLLFLRSIAQFFTQIYMNWFVSSCVEQTG